MILLVKRISAVNRAQEHSNELSKIESISSQMFLWVFKINNEDRNLCKLRAKMEQL